MSIFVHSRGKRLERDGITRHRFYNKTNSLVQTAELVLLLSYEWNDSQHSPMARNVRFQCAVRRFERDGTGAAINQTHVVENAVFILDSGRGESPAQRAGLDDDRAMSAGASVCHWQSE